ncbi:MAG: methyltransferase domain-containing protein [Actinomycetota bacterium]|nr:methyltransferase domain-containing protein [Actinomycetota bacterium]
MDMRDEGRARPRPVSPELYTREYFTSDCEGYHLLESGCEALPERIREALAAAGDLEGRWVLDVGCGRGELACEAARRGAHAVGIDYAPAAIELSLERRAAMSAAERERVEFRLADAKGLDFRDGSFDVVFLIDVYEHLHDYEIEHTLGEIARVLRPWGMLVVHTGPNTWFYRFGYPLVRAAARLLLRRELPEDLRGQYDDVMHVNEQSPLSLHRGLSAGGFRPRVIPRSFFVGIQPNRWEKAAMKMLFARPLGYLFCTSLMATARPSEGGREAQLRAGRMARMLAPVRGSRVLLVGEAEGALANLLAGLEGIEVTWLDVLEEGGHEARGIPAGADLRSVARSEEGHAEEGEEPAPGAALEGTEARGRSPLTAPPCGGGPATPPGAAGGARACERLVGDPCRMPFPDGTFDAVASQFLLDRAEDPAAVLAELARVLKPGGVLALAARNALFRGSDPRPVARPRHTHAPRELMSMAVKAGLTEIQAATLLPDLKLPALYRGDLEAFTRMENIPFLSGRGRLLFLRAVKPSAGGRGCGEGAAD